MEFSASQVMAAVALVSAIFTGIAQIITAYRTQAKVDTVGDKVAAVETRVAEVGGKADVIAGHVNSTATAATAKITALEEQIKELSRTITDNKQTAALLAQSVASGTAQLPQAPAIQTQTPIAEVKIAGLPIPVTVEEKK